jgi:hypothetical protein
MSSLPATENFNITNLLCYPAELVPEKKKENERKHSKRKAQQHR